MVNMDPTDMRNEERASLARQIIDPLIDSREEAEVEIWVDSITVTEVGGPKQAEILFAIAESNGRGITPTSKQVTDHTGLQHGSVTSQLTRMARGGLLERRRWNESEQWEYRVSDEGYQALRECEY